MLVDERRFGDRSHPHVAASDVSERTANAESPRAEPRPLEAQAEGTTRHAAHEPRDDRPGPTKQRTVWPVRCRVRYPDGGAVATFSLCGLSGRACVGIEHPRAADLGADGWFETRLPEGTWTLKAQLPCGLDSDHRTALVDGAISSVPEFDLTVPRPASIRGRVVAPDGSPVAGADIFWTIPEGRCIWSASVRDVKSAADGSFELACLRGGRGLLGAAAAGFAPSRVLEFDLTLGQCVDDVVVQFDPGASVDATVRCAEPNAMRTIEVRLHHVVGEFVLECLGEPGLRVLTVTPTSPTEYVCHLEGAVRGEYELVARITDELGMRDLSYPLVLAGTEHVEVVLEDAVRCGLVFDAVLEVRGEPLVGGRVAANANDGFGWLASTNTDAVGHVRIATRRGAPSVLTIDPSGPPRWFDTVVQPGKARFAHRTWSLDLHALGDLSRLRKLELGGGTIRGGVGFGDLDVTGASVRLRSLGEQALGVRDTCPVAADGTFSFVELPDGDYELHCVSREGVDLGDRVARRSIVRGLHDLEVCVVDLGFGPSNTLNVRVLDPSGVGTTGWVSLYSDSEPRIADAEVRDGVATFERVDDGEYFLVALVGRGWGRSDRIHVRGGGAFDVPVTLGATGLVRLRLVGPADCEPDWDVFERGASTQFPVVLERLPDEDEYEFRLPVGQFEVRAWNPTDSSGDAKHLAEFSVRADELTRVEIGLE